MDNNLEEGQQKSFSGGHGLSQTLFSAHEFGGHLQAPASYRPSFEVGVNLLWFGSFEKPIFFWFGWFFQKQTKPNHLIVRILIETEPSRTLVGNWIDSVWFELTRGNKPNRLDLVWFADLHGSVLYIPTSLSISTKINGV